MSDTFTPNLNLTKPALNASRDTWGQKWNENADSIDAELARIVDEEVGENIPAAITAAIAAALPSGVVVMWSGAASAVPAGWRLCDGTNGTPDLRDRFILGAHAARPVGEVGGAFSFSVATAVAGAHSHAGQTNPTVLTEAQMPSHNHGGITDPSGHHDHAMPLNAPGGGSGGSGALFSSMNPNARVEASGTHQHSIVTDYRGSNAAHVHGIVADGNHTHTVTVPCIPPYYALAFIQRI